MNDWLSWIGDALMLAGVGLIALGLWRAWRYIR